MAEVIELIKETEDCLKTASDSTGFIILKRGQLRNNFVHLTPEEAPRILAELDEYVKSCQPKGL